jgi:riboflavin synthase
MFTGLIEETVSLIAYRILGKDRLQLELQRPIAWRDLNGGDSIAVNGMCLTLEDSPAERMNFSLAYESLKVLLGRDFQDLRHEWESEGGRRIQVWLSRPLHVERAMSMNARWNGHMVTGHVDTMSFVQRSFPREESWILEVTLPAELKPYVWKKGSIAVDGVSLTVNELTPHSFQVCLIPETQNRTHLASLRVGDWVSLEGDAWAKAIGQMLQAHPFWQELKARLEVLERRLT